MTNPAMPTPSRVEDSGRQAETVRAAEIGASS